MPSRTTKILLKQSVKVGLICLAGLFLYLPQRSFAAEWVNIGFADRNINSVAVSRFDKNIAIVNLAVALDGQSTYRTTNGGSSWQPIITLNSICSTQAQNPKNRNEFWAGCLGGLYHSLDSGLTYTKAQSWGAGTYYMSASNDGTFYYTYSNMVYKTRDGIIWENTNLPNTTSSVAYISVNPENGNEVYISKTGTGAGLYRSVDGGSNWGLVSTLWQFKSGINGLFFLGDGNICAIYSTGGESCSSDNGFTWGTFSTPNPVTTAEVSRLYYGVQNPDIATNIIISNVGQSGINPRVYSQSGTDKSKNTVTALPGSTNLIRVSQGTVFSYASSGAFTKGLWRNDGIAVQPEYLTKHPVIIVPGILGSWWMPSGGWQLDPIKHSYDGLYNSFVNAGYTPEKYLFDFPYQWRNDNRDTAVLLKQKINEAKAASGSDKVDIVAHSMGGIVTRIYLEGDNYENDVDHVFFLGTPQLGSVGSYLMWEGFNNQYDEYFFGLFFHFYIKEEAEISGYFGDLGVVEYIRSKVISVSQLLPVFNYIRDRIYPNGYPRNFLLEELNDNVLRITNRGINVVNIAGDTGIGTLRELTNSIQTDSTLWPDGKPIGLGTDDIYTGVLLGEGDGTVLMQSQCYISQGGCKIMDGVSHQNIPNNSVQEIFDVLKISGQPTITKAINRILFVKAYSPVDFYVISPDGKKIGFNSAGEYHHEIDGAFYSGSDSAAEFVTIPNPVPGEYRIVTLGNDTGTYKIESTYIDEEINKEITSSYSGITRPGSEQVVLSSFDIGGNALINKISDAVAPVTKYTVNQSEGDYYSLPVGVSLSAVDDVSGVKNIEISSDGLSWWPYLGEEIILSLEGQNLLFYRATDYAGNVENAQKLSIFIDTVRPNISIGTDKSFYTRYDTLHFECTVNDVGAGLQLAIVSIDGKMSECKNQDIPLTTQTLGLHVISYQAKDNAGNTIEGKIEFQVGATTASIYLDIIRLYSKKQISRAVYIRYSGYLSVYNLLQRSGFDKMATNILSQIVVSAERDKNLKLITETAYNLIKEDILWLRK